MHHFIVTSDLPSMPYTPEVLLLPSLQDVLRAATAYCMRRDAPLLLPLEPQNTMSLCITPYSDCCALHVHVCCVQDFLHAGQVLCIAVDKTGQEERVVLPEAHTLTELPLVSWQ